MSFCELTGWLHSEKITAFLCLCFCTLFNEADYCFGIRRRSFWVLKHCMTPRLFPPNIVLLYIYQCHTEIRREHGTSSNAGFFPTVARGPNPSIRLCSFFGEGFVASLCPQFIYFDTAARVLALASTYGPAREGDMRFPHLTCSAPGFLRNSLYLFLSPASLVERTWTCNHHSAAHDSVQV